MSEPVYVMFQLSMKEAWYALGEKEQNALIEKLGDINKQFGVEDVIVCTSGWSNDEWEFFGVSKYKDLESMRDKYKALDEIPWSRYADPKTIMGTAWDNS